MNRKSPRKNAVRIYELGIAYRGERLRASGRDGETVKTESPSPLLTFHLDHSVGANQPRHPVVLNAIEDVIVRPDLADRAILLTLAPIAERQRRSEHALWQEFELARPHILGALLDAAAHGLHMLPRVRLQRLPRMADFALWATACESAFQPAGTLETAYANNGRDAIKNMVDVDSVAACVREIMADRAQWTGSASDLLQVGRSKPPLAAEGNFNPYCAQEGLSPAQPAGECARAHWPADDVQKVSHN